MADAPFFPGFKAVDVEIDGLNIHAVTGGAGPPLLLVHGASQSHVMWRKIAPELAKHFTVVAGDLRGYGRSGKPHMGDYSKRRMAADQLGLMRALGHERFRLVGHDRGARVSRRLAKDHPGAVERLAILDIVPTAHIYAHVNRKVATQVWHWFFLIQPHPVPEILMGPRAGAFAGGSSRAPEDAAAMADFALTNGTPEAFHGMCQDYRAGATVDLEHDAADADRPIACPTLVLWGRNSPSTATLFDVPAAWAAEATNVRFGEIEAGHFLAEEKPAETLAALAPFLLEGL